MLPFKLHAYEQPDCSSLLYLSVILRFILGISPIWVIVNSGLLHQRGNSVGTEPVPDWFPSHPAPGMEFSTQKTFQIPYWGKINNPSHLHKHTALTLTHALCVRTTVFLWVCGQFEVVGDGCNCVRNDSSKQLSSGLAEAPSCDTRGFGRWDPSRTPQRSS